jgi:hypothetical protein
MPKVPTDEEPKKWRMVVVMHFAATGNKWATPISIVRQLGFEGPDQEAKILPKILNAIRYSGAVVFEKMHPEFPVPTESHVYRLSQEYIDRNPVVKAVIEDTK